MEKVVIQGYNVDENLLTGQEYLGNVGLLLGVVEMDNKYFAIVEDANQSLYSKKVVIDTSVEMCKNGPSVRESLYFSEVNIPLSDNVSDRVREIYQKYGNLDLLYDGEVNVELGLMQQNNTVYIGSDELIEHLVNLKAKKPTVPLYESIKIEPFSNENVRYI